MDPKLRALMLALAIGAAALAALSRLMAPLRAPLVSLPLLAACAAYALARIPDGDLRRRLLGQDGAPRMLERPETRRARLAMALLESAWMSAGLCACLPWGLPGVMALLFQGLFLAGFGMARRSRPGMFAGKDASSAADVMEALLLVQAMAAMAAYIIYESVH